MKRLSLLVLICLIAPILVSCSSESAATPTDPPPTRTPFPTFVYVEPTKAAVFDVTPTPSERQTVDNIALDEKKVSRGRGRYEALECANCHGESGEGTDQGKSLLDFALPEEDFITFLRSGGEVGLSHQYSTDRLSNNGSRNLYQYLVSLAQGS